MPLYELTADVTCHRPARWHGHLRYALCIPQQALTLPAGSWLLALPNEADSEEHLYRLHACQVGTLYGWSLGGRVPATYDYDRHGWSTLRWPDGRECPLTLPTGCRFPMPAGCRRVRSTCCTAGC